MSKKNLPKMKDLLNIKKITDKKVFIQHDEYEEECYHINRIDNKDINTQMFKDIYSNLKTKYGAKSILVRALNNQHLFTFKGFDEEELNFEDFEEYYKNKVQYTDKFEYFKSLQITVLKPNSLKK